MEMQQDSNEKQNKLIERQSQQLVNLGNTIERLNDKIDRTDKKVEETADKGECLEKVVTADSNRDKIDLRDIRDKLIWTGIGIGGTALSYGLINLITNNIK